MTRVPLTVLILALAAAFFLLATAPAPADAAGREVLHDWRAQLAAVPGQTTKVTKRAPRRFPVDRMLLKIGGKFAAVADHRGCSVDAARGGVILTLNACRKGRITVRTATTGAKRVRVFVRLTQFVKAAPGAGRDGGGEPSPAPAPAACADPVDGSIDTDCDGEPDASDVCPAVADEDQPDADGDGIGDACEVKS